MSGRRQLALVGCGLLLVCGAPVAGELINDHDVRPARAGHAPIFLMPTKDPVFGTTITRVTDPGQLPNVSRIRHYYSKANPFNSDGSRAVMFGSDGSIALYDTEHWRPIRVLGFDDGEPEVQWHPSDPALMYHLGRPPGAQAARAMYRMDVSTGQRTLLRDFNRYVSARGKLEGNLDIAGRYFALVGKKVDGSFEAFTYDIRDDKLSKAIPVRESMVSDWISVSPTGKFVVMMGKDRSRVFDIEMNHVRDLAIGSFGHGDLCLKEDGSEALVYDGADRQLDSNRNINMVDLATGHEIKLVRIGWRTTPHVSCRNTALPGWALVSTQGPDNKYPVHDFEIFWVKLDGSGEVRRVAHHHSLRERGGYFAEQHATSDRRGTRIVFASNWDGSAPIASYIVEGATPVARTPR